MSGHLEDEILDGLRSAPSAAWERLHTLVEHLEVDNLASQWRGGPASAGPDGTYQMPYVSWSDPLTTLVDTLYEVKAIAVIDWSTWASSYPFGDVPQARAANVMEAVCWVTAVVRADRFDEGVLKEAVDDGTFLTLVQRVLAWNLADCGRPELDQRTHVHRLTSELHSRAEDR